MEEKQDQSKLVAIISYITLIGWVIALVLNSNNKTELGSFHIRQSLIIMVTGLVLAWIPVIGWVLGIVLFIFWIMGLVSAVNETQKEVPIIGPLAQQWLKGL